MSIDDKEAEVCSEVDPRVPIRNFRRVTPWLFRGGQPGAEGIATLKELGIRTVVNLRSGRRHVNAEREAVIAAGINFINIPLSYWFLPTEKIIDEFLALLDDESTHPLFVHCLHGADRTGLLVAMYRVARQNWRVEDAYKEMKLCGFHRFRIRNFKWMLWRLARKYKSTDTPS